MIISISKFSKQKNDIAALVKKTDFVDELKKLYKKNTSNKTKHVETEKN